MTLPDGTVIPPTGKAFDLEFAQTSKWDGDQLIVISAFWDAALQSKQLGLPQRKLRRAAGATCVRRKEPVVTIRACRRASPVARATRRPPRRRGRLRGARSLGCGRAPDRRHHP